MTTDHQPAQMSLCGGRLVGEPLMAKVRFYDGTPGTWFAGRWWLLDGEHVSTADSLAFRAQWENGQHHGDATDTGAVSSSEHGQPEWQQRTVW